MLKWRHPLWWLPDVPSEQDEAYRRIWQNLRQVENVADGRHIAEGSRDGEDNFVMCCARIPATSLLPRLDQLRDALRPFPYVRLHPDSFLHIPVQELGFLVDDPRHRGQITYGWLKEFIAQSAIPIREFAPFPVTLGGVNSFVDAAFLDVHDNGWLSRIHGRLVDFVQVSPTTRYAYLPVATIAYYTGDAPVGALVAALTPFRDVEFGTFRIESLDVVKLQTGVPYPDMELIHRFELGHHHAFLDVMHGNATTET